MMSIGQCSGCSRSTKTSYLRGRLAATDVMMPASRWEGLAQGAGVSPLSPEDVTTWKNIIGSQLSHREAVDKAKSLFLSRPREQWDAISSQMVAAGVDPGVLLEAEMDARGASGQSQKKMSTGTKVAIGVGALLLVGGGWALYRRRG